MTKLIKKGYEPPVHDFFLSNLYGRDITEDILNDKKISCILIIPDLEKGIKRIKDYQRKLVDIAFYTDYNHFKFYCFTSSETLLIKQYKNSLPPYAQILTGDYKMLKTFIRSNPGIVILKDGIILKKYHYLNIPDVNTIKKLNQ